MPVRGGHRWQWNIGKVMAAVAVCAIGLSSPMLSLFAGSLVLWWLVRMGTIYTRTGRRLAEALVLVLVLLAVILFVVWVMIQTMVAAGALSR